MTRGEALSTVQLRSAFEIGARLALELIEEGIDCLALGEIGIGNTTTSAALASAMTGSPPSVTVGRGTGMDAAGVERKRALVASALEFHSGAREPGDVLCALGGLELAALVGAIRESAAHRVPVVLRWVRDRRRCARCY